MRVVKFINPFLPIISALSLYLTVHERFLSPVSLFLRALSPLLALFLASLSLSLALALALALGLILSLRPSP